MISLSTAQANDLSLEMEHTNYDCIFSIFGLKKITFEYKSRFPIVWLGKEVWFLISTIEYLFLS